MPEPWRRSWQMPRHDTTPRRVQPWPPRSRTATQALGDSLAAQLAKTLRPLARGGNRGAHGRCPGGDRCARALRSRPPGLDDPRARRPGSLPWKAALGTGAVTYEATRRRRTPHHGQRHPHRDARRRGAGRARRHGRKPDHGRRRQAPRDRHHPPRRPWRPRRAPRRRLEDRLRRLHDGDDGLLPGHVAHQRQRQDARFGRPLLQPRAPRRRDHAAARPSRPQEGRVGHHRLARHQEAGERQGRRQEGGRESASAAARDGSRRRRSGSTARCATTRLPR